jgi:hypothetical protein
VSWLAWRQFRANALLAAAAIAAIVVVLVLTGHHVAQVADPNDLRGGYQALRLLGTALIGTPAFIGAAWGAPLLARELEAGTHRLAWTQSVTRRRWLSTKLLVVGTAAIVVTGAFSLVFTWWSLPFDEVGNRVGTANFGQRGITPVAYAIFALALGTFMGALLRRTLPAMTATLLAFFVVRYSFQLVVRPRLLGPVVATLPNNLFGQRADAAPGGWILSSKTVDGAGHHVATGQVDGLLANACDLTRESTKAEWIRCTDQLGLHDVVRMHPADHFWALQMWEAASFLVLAGLLTAGCFWWIRHRSI